MISISVCMIVKNEEMIIKRCLDSLTEIADEIIIVDTGSSDQTIALCEQYTSKVYQYSWTNNFSEARNYCFSLATKEYIYSADADEVLFPEEIDKMKELKKSLDPNVDIVQMRYGNQLQYNTIYNYNEEYRPKLFKR